MCPLSYFLGKQEIDFVGAHAVEVKYRTHVDITEFDRVQALLPRAMRLTVVTKQTWSQKGRVQCIPLKDWLLRKHR
ncbi:MAG: hypothetical protein GF331_07300 [Chitinivibrionales bacterium]|nr:hypothetical protein [Chitinivibrionales bacterium]